MAVYLTNAEADTYFATYRLVTDVWDDATEPEKTKAIAIATRQIDALKFDGDKAVAGQALQFPRGSDTSVPAEIQEACAECAYSLLDGVDVEFENDNLRSVSMGFANVRSSDNTGIVPEHRVVGIPSFIGWMLLKPYLRSLDSVNMMRTS